MNVNERIIDLVKKELIPEANEMLIEELDFTDLEESKKLFAELVNIARSFYYSEKQSIAHEILSDVVNYLSVRVAISALYEASLFEAKTYLNEGKTDLALKNITICMKAAKKLEINDPSLDELVDKISNSMN